MATHGSKRSSYEEDEELLLVLCCNFVTTDVNQSQDSPRTGPRINPDYQGILMFVFSLGQAAMRPTLKTPAWKPVETPTGWQLHCDNWA